MKDESKAAQLPDPPALADEYHKARRQLMLWSGILFAWELVGVDLGKAAQADGTIGAVVNAIKSPQAVPWVILILVAYFVFRLSVEWLQSSHSRRTLRVARVDFGSCLAVAVIAYALYFGQRIAQVQFADYFLTPTGIAATMGFVIGFVLVVIWTSVRLGYALGTTLFIAPGFISMFVAEGLNPMVFFLGLPFGMATALGVKKSSGLMRRVQTWPVLWQKRA